MENNMIWVKSKSGKPVHAVWMSSSRHNSDTAYFYLTFTQDMADKGIPVEVPDVDMFRNRTDLEIVRADDAEPIAKKYVAERKAAASDSKKADAKAEEFAESVASEVKEMLKDNAKCGRPKKTEVIE
jgi:hypothetical protein